ncbi:MAG: lipid A deacylase LpxR family protein [Pseudomonadota bacterium]
MDKSINELCHVSLIRLSVCLCFITGHTLVLSKEAQAGEKGTVTALVENDYFAQRDRNYTNGLRLSYVTPTIEAREFEKRLLGPDDGLTKHRRSYSIGQALFTPDDIFTADPQPNDHPYAGYLFGEYALVAEHKQTIEIFTVEFGLVGPWAQGEETQNLFHRHTGREVAEGWDHQIDNEPALTLSYDRKLPPVLDFDAGLLEIDMSPSFGGSLGNVRTHAQAGLSIRIGSNLPTDYGPARIRPSLTGAGYFSSEQPISWYAFGGIQGRAVVHSIFLDGSLFDDTPPGVNSEPFVSDIQTGLAVQIAGVQFAWTYVFRSERFEGQEGSDRFGAVSLSFKL